MIIIIAITVYFILEEPKPSLTPTPTATTPAPTLPPFRQESMCCLIIMYVPQIHHIERELNKAECIHILTISRRSYKSLTMYDNY